MISKLLFKAAKSVTKVGYKVINSEIKDIKQISKEVISKYG